MKRLLSLLLTVLTLISIVSVSFVSTNVVANAATALPFSSTANMSQYLSGFADENQTYYKISDGTKTSVKQLAIDGNVPCVTQGATCIGKDIYFTATYSSKLDYTPGYIVKRESSDGKYYVSDPLPISHGNDLCYNPDKNWILVANNKPEKNALTIINPDDLTLIKQIRLEHIYGTTGGLYAVDYNPKTKRYIVCSSGTDTMNYILDEDFQVVSSHQRQDPNLDKTTKPYYLKQGMCSTPDYLLHVYAGAPVGTYDNQIIVTDWDGNYIQTIKDTVKHEIEDVYFNDDGYLYFVYYVHGSGAIYLAKTAGYTIKYLPNGGKGTMADSQHYYGTSKTISANKFTRSGYTFAGWKLTRKSDGKALYTNDNMSSNSWYVPGKQPAGYRRSVYGDKRSVSALAHDVHDEVYLEAQWKPNLTGTKKFYIEFDPNGGTGSMEMFPCVWGQRQILPENTITREDYKFIGWSARRNSTDYWRFFNVTTGGSDVWQKWTSSTKYALRLYQPGNLVSKTSNSNGDVVEFMCQWEYIPNSVFVFDANGGSGAMDNQKLVHGTPSALTLNTFTKSGNVFAGWVAQKSDGSYYLANGTWSKTGTPYVFKDGETVNNIGDGKGDKIKMVAQWEKIKEYTIKFDANGGTGEMADVTVSVDSAYTLPANTFTKTGYAFAGWSDGTNTYADEAEVINLAQAEETVTLTAQWSPITYTIKFDANGGSGEMADVAPLVDLAYTLPANTFTKTGYAFAGWTDGTNTYADEAEVINLAQAGETVTLTAQWAPTTYTIKFDANGGSGEMADVTVSVDSAFTLPANTFTKTGYAFAGWTDGTNTYADEAEVINLAQADETVTLTAQWTPITYTIKFDANGGSGEMADVTVSVDSAFTLPANAFAKTGYAFAGWTDGTNTYADKVEVLNLAQAGETVTLTAQWTPTTYTIKFDANGGTGEMADVTATVDLPLTLPTNAFAKTGYTFAGWATSSTGDVVYSDKKSVINLTATNGETVTLYAKWTPVGNVEVVNNICDNDGVIYTSESDVFKKNSELTCTYNIWYSADGSEYSEYMINGSSSFTLKAGESKLFTNLVVGYYKIVEANNKCVAATSYNTDEIITVETESSNSQSNANNNEAIIQIKEITTEETNLRQYKVDFKNYLIENKIVLKYYPRLMQQGKPADMSPVASSISKTFVGMECNPDVPDLIINAALDFDYDSANMIEDYIVFTSQDAAEKTMRDTFNYHTNSNYGEGVSLHTNQYGYTQTGSDEWNDNEKWVNYKQVTYSIDSDGKLVKSDAENYDYESSDKSVVPSEIKVWIFNKPKVYTVRYHSPNTIDDLNEKTVSFNGKSVKVYVADTNSQTNAVSAYYNQKNGPWTSSQGTNEQTEHLKNYGIPAYNGAIIDIPQTFTYGTTNLEFKYWAFDAEGKQFASNDPRYRYRILNDIELYPVYVSNDEENASTKGLSITELQTEKYVNDNGVEKICLNQTMNPYNCDDYDANISDASVVYVMLNRNNLDAIDMQRLRDGIKEVLSENDTADKFSGKKIPIIDVTLTVNGFIYDVTYYGGSDSDSQIELTNKNRLQFSTTFNASAFSKGNTRMLCFAGMKYSGEWIVSDNYVDYNFLI